MVTTIAAPIIVVLVIARGDIAAWRDVAYRDHALRQAERYVSDIDNIVGGGRQLATVIAQSIGIQAVNAQDRLPGCTSFLQAMLTASPGYDSMTIFADNGDTICTTLAQQSDVVRLRYGGLMQQSLQTNAFALGGYTPASAGRGAVLPIALPFPLRDSTRRGVVMLTLNLDWLHHQIAYRDIASGASVGIADADGTTLVRLPVTAGTSYVGKPVSPAILPYVRASRRGTVNLPGYDARPQLIAYIPTSEVVGNSPNPSRFFVTYAMPGTGAEGWADVRTIQLAAAFGLSLLLGLIGGILLFVRPVSSLLAAARSWSAGDLSARAKMPALTAFHVLAVAFNRMAERLSADRRSLRELNLTLENRVHERTHDIDQSRDRLEQQMVERGKIEAELRRAQKLQVVGQLAGGIAHHFNNLLTAVIGSLDLLRRRAALGTANDDSHHINSLIDGALLAADRGRRLTAQLLIFSRAQRMLPRPVDLNATITQLNDLLVGTLGRGIRIDLSLAATDSPGMGPVMVDPGQLEVALVNLAINARDAMDTDGDPRGVLTISTAAVRLPGDMALGPATAPGNYVAVRIADTGSGIAPDLLPQVFEPFFSTKSPDRGSGLGLSQVQSLAVQSGGDVRIESIPGEGTIVLLLLPRAGLALDCDPPVSLPLAAKPSQKLRVLLVDDDQLVGDVIGELLTERGHEVVAATNAVKAIEVLTRDAQAGGPGFDLLLTDYVMPGMTGLALIATARHMRPAQPALLMTGHASFEPGDTIDPDEVIRKPFTMVELLTRIEQRSAA
ncbi:MAG: response regulator [Acetobacteraceae bacterium]|nr:response regulator [Acetobacteraceae bacterium]